MKTPNKTIQEDIQNYLQQLKQAPSIQEFVALERFEKDFIEYSQALADTEKYDKERKELVSELQIFVLKARSFDAVLRNADSPHSWTLSSFRNHANFFPQFFQKLNTFHPETFDLVQQSSGHNLDHYQKIFKRWKIVSQRAELAQQKSQGATSYLRKMRKVLKELSAMMT